MRTEAKEKDQVSIPEGFQRMDNGFDLGMAVAEAGRCLLCHEPACSQACPAGTDPGAFLRKLRLGNITGAIRTIKTNNILGGACGVLCPTARLCEKECAAKALAQPVRIGKVQRFLVEHAWNTGLRPFRQPLYEAPPRKAERVAVVGGGPAGLACAAELAHHGYPVTILEERPEAGGVLRYGVPSFRLHPDFLNRELDDLRDLGVEIRCSSRIADRGAVEHLLEQGFKAVFVGIGLWEALRLTDDHARIAGVWTATDFLAALRREQFADLEPACRGKVVTVIGGGSVAIDCARAALRLGARDVHLVYRRSYAQMPAEEDERVEALREGINLLPLQRPVEYVTARKRTLRGLRLMRTRLGDPDGSGRRAPLDIPDSEWTLDCDVAIEAIGTRAPEASRDWYPTVKTDKVGCIQADPATRATSHPGIFAGGDIVRGPDLVVGAIEDGKKAARGIMAYLTGQAG